MKEFSHGLLGSVYEVSGRAKVAFFASDLVKIEWSQNPYDGRVIYYMMKLAHFLYPQNFIDVFGCVTDEQRDHTPLIYRNATFSKEAFVSRDHAIYARHRNKGDHMPRCSCGVCLSHFQFHRETNLADKAYLFKHQIFDRSGLIVPYSDTTDYCCDSMGNIVFFEVNNLLTHTAKMHIDQIEDQQKRAFANGLLNRLTKVRELWRTYTV